MAFKLTYTDGHEDNYGDSTHWEVDDGVLKMGREKGEWSVYVSPSHWATIEVGNEKRDADGDKKDSGKSKNEKDEDDKDGDNDGETGDDDTDDEEHADNDAAKEKQESSAGA